MEIAKGVSTETTSFAAGAKEPHINLRDMKYVVLEYLQSPPDHFKSDGHCPEKHMKFVGVETVNLKKKSMIPERVQFWETKCVPRSQ